MMVFSVCVRKAVRRIICIPQAGRQRNAEGLHHVKNTDLPLLGICHVTLGGNLSL